MKETIRKRNLLFRKSKPVFRPFVPYENGEIGNDMGILWASYQRGGFDERFVPSGMDTGQFHVFTVNLLSIYDSLWIVEDENGNFKSGHGPVAIICIWSKGWSVEPNVYFFPWKTAKNVLRSYVGFFQKTRHDKTVGVCFVKVMENAKSTIDHCAEYVPMLRFVGKIWFGDPRGDLYFYSLKGGNNAWNDGRRPDAKRPERDRGREWRESPSEERESELPGEDLPGGQDGTGHRRAEAADRTHSTREVPA